MNKFLTLLLLALPAFSQTGQPHPWNCFPDATLTEDAYWAHQPPAVRVLRADSSSAMQLAQQGYKIDVVIMVWHQPATCTMGVRLLEGYTWVPNALQPNVPTTPGNDLPGIPPYDALHPPAGSILVSNDIKDYPAYVDPTAPPAPAVIPQANIVGTCFPGAGAGGKTICAGGLGAGAVKLTDGEKVTQGGKDYIVRITAGFIGTTILFEQQ